MFLFPVPYSWALLSVMRTAGSLGTRAAGIFVIHLNHSLHISYGLPLSFLNKLGGHLKSNAGECFSKILFVSKSAFNMKCEWVLGAREFSTELDSQDFFNLCRKK